MTELVLQNGHIAVATLRKPSALADLTSQYTSDRLLTLKLDVTKADEVAHAFAKAEEAFGRIDVVFNNAGYGVVGEIEGTPDEVARAIFDTNFWGAVYVSKEAVRCFREVNKPAGGRLLQVSSLSGVEGRPILGFYVASKFALEGLSESLASEVDPEWNIKVSIIEPGGFRNESIHHNMQHVPAHPAYTKPNLTTAVFRQYLESNPLFSGDPRKAVQKIYKLAALPEPPLHFPLGKDSIAGVRDKTMKLLADTDQYESWSEGINIDE